MDEEEQKKQKQQSKKQFGTIQVTLLTCLSDTTQIVGVKRNGRGAIYEFLMENGEVKFLAASKLRPAYQGEIDKFDSNPPPQPEDEESAGEEETPLQLHTNEYLGSEDETFEDKDYPLTQTV